MAQGQATHSKIVKWGNSAAVRLPARVLAAAGLERDSEVDIQAGDGCVVIQLREKTLETALDEALADIPEAAEVIALCQEKLTKSLAKVNEAIDENEVLIKKLQDQGAS
jgi:antitoxin MazE